MEKSSIIDIQQDLLEDAAGSGIWSKTFEKTEKVNAVIMKLSSGEDLSEHTSGFEGIIHVIEGEGIITVGDKTVEAKSGTWIHMPPKTTHSVQAVTDFTFLLYLLK